MVLHCESVFYGLYITKSYVYHLIYKLLLMFYFPFVCIEPNEIEMEQHYLLLAFIFPPALLIISRLITLGNKSNISLQLAKFSSISAILISVLGGLAVYTYGSSSLNLVEFEGLGISFKFDGLSLIMYGMVSIIGLVVLRFSDNYLGGDEGRSKFIGGLAFTVALVQLMVISGNLFVLFLTWALTGVVLKKLILFYSDRPRAQIAASKKQLVSVLGNISMLVSFVLIYLTFGTGDLSLIFNELQSLTIDSVPFSLEVAAIFLVATAAFKSAQLPMHGWLLEVMEAPTPVSALLHAGLLNAGPFLMIRFAFLLDTVSIAPIVLFTLGAITAFYGAVVFSTQSTIKNALAYSSVGHMGFSLMSCGLGIYSAGLLHLVAHSFYKAHAFLSSGSLVEKVRTNQNYNYKRTGNGLKVALGFLGGLGVFVLIANLWGISLNSHLPLLLISAVILAGIMKLLISTIDSTSFSQTLVRVIITTVVLLNLFFGLEALSNIAIGGQIPNESALQPTLMIIAVTVFTVFIITIVSQSVSPLIKHQNLTKKIGIHARQGFYVNVLFNRVIKSLNHKN